MPEMTDNDWKLAVVDWRDRTFELYRKVRELHPTDPEGAFGLFCATRDALFREHPASPLDDDQRREFGTLPYVGYRHEFNIEAALIPVANGRSLEIELGDDGALRLVHVADARFSLASSPYSLPVYWLADYGGGIFIPFQDASNGSDTYGGGRYLFDTRKGANLGFGATTIRLDLNFAYNPSCAYHQRWVCPLPPRKSRLPLAICAGEKYALDGVTFPCPEDSPDRAQSSAN
jgi:uncharacterized protein (DUF1684 family)